MNSCRYLGVVIDDELKWSEHIEHIYGYVLKYVGIFYKLRNKNPAGVMNKWHSYRSGTCSPEGAEIMHQIYAKLWLCMHTRNRKRCCRTSELYFDLEDGTSSQ